MTLLGISQRLPPSNARAEQALLGALLANNAAYDRVAEFLRPIHFADPVHGRVYAAITARIEAGRLADVISLKADLEGAGALDDVGGTAYLVQLLSAMVGIINTGEYGRAVLDAWMRRELIAAGEDMVNAAFGTDPPSDATAVLEAHEAALLRISEGAGNLSPLVPAGDAVQEAIRITEAAAKRESPLAGITTGFAALDRRLLGLQPGKLVLLAARPSMGKTGLGLAIAARAAASGAHVLYWSGEMAPVQLGARLAAAHAGLSMTAVFTGRGWHDPEPNDPRPRPRELTAEEWAELAGAERAARRLPLQFDGRPGISVAALRARARRLRRGKKLDLLVVDYVGLMRASAGAERQKLYEQVTEISRDLTALKIELNIPVLALAQLSRETERREDKRPQLSDLRDSGALEQDADVVMFLHRPEYYLERTGLPPKKSTESEEKYDMRQRAWNTELAEARGVAHVYVDKNRQGAPGVAKLAFHARTTWFRDGSEEPDSPAWAASAA